MFQNGSLVALVDVRSVEKWNASHVENATSVPLLDEGWNEHANVLVGCEDAPIATYCDGGG